jgi:hypothetical protein
MRKLSISIEDFHDLFSDFDARTYEERSISEDFLYELKKVANESEEEINELLLITKTHKIDEETIIIKRLQDHFKNRHNHYINKKKKEQQKGLLFFLIGSILLFIATYLLLKQKENILLNALIVVLEPAGWFLSWTGLETLFNNTKWRTHDLSFYTKIRKCKVHFSN